MFAAIRGLLEERCLLLKAGAIVDATIIAAPTSTKNATGTRDPAMMKIHIGTDTPGIVHSL